MKYSKRELKTFNVFALFLFGLGGLFLILGGLEFFIQPTTSYVAVRKPPEAISSIEQSEESTILSSEESDALVLEEPGEGQRDKADQKGVVMVGMNLKAVSNVLLGGVFLVLSFALNFVLLRVMRQSGYDKLKPVTPRE